MDDMEVFVDLLDRNVVCVLGNFGGGIGGLRNVVDVYIKQNRTECGTLWDACNYVLVLWIFILKVRFAK